MKRDAAWVALLRLVIQAFLFLSGFRVLSVDEYLRVSVAVQTAKHWAWFPDPFFLPAYFWIYSVPLRLGLTVQTSAVGLTILFSAGCSSLFYLWLRRMTASRETAWTGSILWSLQPAVLWLGGVPLSETLGLFLLLGALYGWSGASKWSRFLSAFCLGIGSLVRYEVWLTAVVLSIFVWFEKTRPRKERLARSSIGVSGILLFLMWRGLQADPLGPIRMVQAAAFVHLTPSTIADRLFWFAVGTFPLVVFAFVAVASGLLRRHIRVALSLMVLVVIALSFLPLLTPLFRLSHYPLVFPERLILIPCTLLTGLAFIAADRWILQITRPLRMALLVSIGLIFCGLAAFPPAEVQPETIDAARQLNSILKTMTHEQRVLVERKDLGWTALWGLTNGDPRIVFDRPTLRTPPPWKSRAESDWWGQFPCVVCTLSSSKNGAAAFRSLPPRTWKLRWSAGKYTLACLTDEAQSGSSHPHGPTTCPDRSLP
ncbi:MAG TPA: hypothetical protein VI895_03935 [Bdellovibrionota bacterium]|nr:hypothetical protein [Bdellovibrionota bacterium]